MPISLLFWSLPNVHIWFAIVVQAHSSANLMASGWFFLHSSFPNVFVIVFKRLLMPFVLLYRCQAEIERISDLLSMAFFHYFIGNEFFTSLHFLSEKHEICWCWAYYFGCLWKFCMHKYRKNYMHILLSISGNAILFWTQK